MNKKYKIGDLKLRSIVRSILIEDESGTRGPDPYRDSRSTRVAGEEVGIGAGGMENTLLLMAAGGYALLTSNPDAKYVYPVPGDPPVASYPQPRRDMGKGPKPHRGMDISVPSGTPVVAIADGTISYNTGQVPEGAAGCYISISHNKTPRPSFSQSHYMHLHKIAVESGDVKRGQLIGYSGGGDTDPCKGEGTTGAHLHFGLTKRGDRAASFNHLFYDEFIKDATSWKKGDRSDIELLPTLPDDDELERDPEDKDAELER